uniref:Ig-like domain-containing protein n=1 Tax=Chromobacterium amazonense TaxID=1382803 RepID=UPI000AA8BC46
SDTPSFSGGNLTVHISANGQSAEDALGISTSGSITLSSGTSVGSTVSVGGVAIGTIATNGDGVSGHDLIVSLNSNATASRVSTLVDALTYNDTAAGIPNTSTRTIQVTVNDGRGGTSSAASVTMAVSAAPLLSASGGSAAFTAGDNATSTPVAVDSGITVTDNASPTLASGTVSITGNFHSGEDTLAFSNTNSTTYGNIVGSYNSGTGVLTLTSSGATATLAQWQAALRAVTYTDSAVTPNTATRTVSFQVADGSSNSSAILTRTVTVTATDQTPIATASGGSTAFTAGDNATSTPVVVDSGITVSDLDNTTLASGTVSITGNFHSGEDVLSFTNTSAITYGNIVGSYNSGTGVLTLTSSGATATLSQWQAALRAVKYTDSAVTPNNATRTVSFVVNDGTKNSAATTKTVTVAATDQTPLLTASGGSAAFTAGNNVTSTPVAVDTGITVSDLDNTTLASATVSITGNFHSGEDTLAFTNTNPPLRQYQRQLQQRHRVLTLTSSGATATLAQWQAALQAVTYNDTAGSPNTATRTISFTVNDGTVNSAAVTRNIAIQLPTPTVTGLTAGTDTGSSSSDGITSDNTPTVTGTAEGGSTVTIYVDGVSVGTTTANGSGAWSYNFSSSLTDGSHAITAMATSGSVNSSVSSGYSVTIDTAAPTAPAGLALSAATDTGSSHSDGITDNNQPTVQGTAEAGSTVTVYVDGTAVGTATANGSGVWSYNLSSPLADGNHSIRATATDAAGNVSAQSGGYNFIVDTSSPQVQSFTAADSLSTSASTLSYQVVFSKPVASFNAAALSVVADSGVTATISSVTQINATTYAIQLTGVSGGGALSVAIKNGTVTDLAGNTLSGSIKAPVYHLTTTTVTSVSNPITPATPLIQPTASNSIQLPPITPNIVLAAVSGNPIVTTTGSNTVPGTVTLPVTEHVGSGIATPTFGGTDNVNGAVPSFVSNVAINPAIALQVNPDLGVRPLVSGQSFSLTLPPATIITRESSANLSIVARQSDGQPLPSWLKFDPATGKFTGQAPAGWNKPISIDIRVQDKSGHHGNSHIQLNFGQSRANGAAGGKAIGKTVAGKLALNQQFDKHGHKAFLQQMQDWLEG